MGQGSFRSEAAKENNEILIKRENDLHYSENDIRSCFARDYTRILHSLAYRRLKHKTQVFFNIDNDHICTRMEHVAHVDSISSTIAKYLGLNDELTKAISIGHDIGHAPFGHHGENIIKDLTNKHLHCKFWHEKNGLRFVDEIELLENEDKIYKNLNLTYAVRDGIVAHCGEIDENGLKPRKCVIDLKQFNTPGEYQPITWEGCIVKISDKIAYIGRDIEDALCLGFLNEKAKSRLNEMARVHGKETYNNTVIIQNLIMDICKNSSPEKGICLSDDYLKQINEIKGFNYEYIYGHKRLRAFKDYAEMIIKNIFNTLLEAYDGNHTWGKLDKLKPYSNTLVLSFSKWLARYCNDEIVPDGDLQRLSLRCKNSKIYGNLETREIYIQAILDYIAGMTDRFAISIFNEFLIYSDFPY